MKLGVAEKILRSHLAAGEPEAGKEVLVRVDQTLTQDATGTMAYLQLEALGVARVATRLSVSYVDHNTIQEGFENADDHRYLQTTAARFGVVFSRPGNGICHQVHLERFGIPGQTLLGSDSHTPTAGGLGMLAIGAGGLDVALAMAGRPFSLRYPRVVRVELRGELPPWVTAKDVILHLLGRFSSKGNVGQVLEYSGPALARLSVPERATITNMGAETGVTTSVFPADAVTRDWLEAQDRAADFAEIGADPGAAYARAEEVDLAALAPLAACPHSPDNVRPVAELAGTRVNQVAIGSCTNSSLADLKKVAAILRGKRVHPGVCLAVAPGSRQVLELIARDGDLADLLAAGARVVETACGFCIGNSLAPASGGVSLRTSNRNFPGRSGTKDADVFLVSPETAAAAALTGEITDPRELGAPPAVTLPAKLATNDALIVRPPADGSAVAIERGPNIGAPPAGTPVAETVRGTVAIKVGDKISTDAIMPAGARLKYRSNIPRYAEFVFEPLDPDFPARCRRLKEKGREAVIVAGESYGQGSSREHAAICPMYLGVRAVIARSLERIHAANLVNYGILPLVFADPADFERLRPDDEVELPEIRRRLAAGEPLRLRRPGRGEEIRLEAKLTPREREIVLAGGRTAYEKNQPNEKEA